MPPSGPASSDCPSSQQLAALQKSSTAKATSAKATTAKATTAKAMHGSPCTVWLTCHDNCVCACELCVNDPHGRAETNQSPFSRSKHLSRRNSIHTFACCIEIIKVKEDSTSNIHTSYNYNACAGSTRDSTATFPLLKPRTPVFCMWTRLMYPADPSHTPKAPEKRVGVACDLRYVRIDST